MKDNYLLFRMFRSLANRATRFFNHYVLGPIDCWIIAKRKEELQHPPIFIIGAPRSGSTLLVQVLTDAFDLGYISNSHCRLFGSLLFASKFKAKDQPNKEYKSRHGTTKGGNSPSECGEYWYRFFRRKPAYVTNNDVDTNKLRCFRDSIVSFSNSIGKSVLFKNLYASLRLQSIIQTFPEALFIVIKRDLLNNGCSLLEGRKNVFGTYEKWWSVEPDNIESLRALPAYKQVIEQVRSIYRVIDRDLMASRIDLSRVMYIQYEEFCFNTHRTIVIVNEFFQSHGINAAQKYSVPVSFIIKKKIDIEKNIYNEMKKYMSVTSSTD